MERITRHIERPDRGINYEFTTYDFVLRLDTDPPPKFYHENFLKLTDHLKEAFIRGLPFREASASGAKRLILKTERLKGHEFSTLAAQAEARGKKWDQHKILQAYFMKNQKYTIAMEVPVWGKDMNALIDLLLIYPQSGIVDLLDYKPNALKEKNAATQIYHCKRLLMENTGISGEFIRPFYFDEDNTYQLIS